MAGYSRATPAEEIQLLFERLGFQCFGRLDSDDASGRAGTSWYTLLLELRITGTLRANGQCVPEHPKTLVVGERIVKDRSS